jgi:4-amino-4-deoxy-L-arabinose transferase-like glycosyltransferase
MTTSVLDSPSDGSHDRLIPERPSLGRRLCHPEGRPAWELPALATLLLGTALLYLWNLGASGNANDFYAAAVQAGTKSWKAFFFGSFDSSNFITVDKPPASLWVMELSGRLFGFSSWSMLVPQALEGVAAVALLYAAVRRWFGPAAGLLAGALFALTPVAALMFRFNNPDALMTLLIVAAAYCVVRAVESASTRWLLLAGAALGFSFLTKGLQPFTVLPALAAAYLVAAPTGFGRRIWQLLAAGAAILVSAGWWVAAVQLTPAADRPYVGGSTDNSVLGLAFGYNGLGRITGNESGGGFGGGGGASFSGSTGLGRLFNSLNGSQVAWLLPAALLGILALVALAGRAPRTDRTRVAAIIWGGWLLVTGLVLSFAGGVIHTYYTVELAPAIAAVVAIAAVTLWRARADINARLALAVGVVVTGGWTYVLLERASGWNTWLNYLVATASLTTAAALLVPSARFKRGAVVAVIAGVIAVGAGPAAYAVDTADTPQTGAIPSAGPAASGAQGGFGGARGGAGRLGYGGFPGAGSGGFPGAGRGTPGQTGSAGGDGSSAGQPSTGEGPGSGSAEGATGAQLPSGTGARGGFAGAGGGQSANSALVALLESSTTKWAAATVGSQSAAPLELASGKAVMALGGFTGSDPSPTLAQFEKWVTEGKIHYFIGSGNSGGPGRGNSEISTWVAAHFTSTTVGGSTVYDLTKQTS